MAEDLNISMSVSLTGSTKGSDNIEPWLRRFAESWSMALTYGSTTTARQAEYVHYYSLAIGASAVVTLNMTALAAADGKTYAFTSYKGFIVSWPSTAAGTLRVAGDGLFNSSSVGIGSNIAGYTDLVIHPGGFAAFANPNGAYLLGGGNESLMFQSVDATQSNDVTYAVIGSGAII